MTLVIFMIKTIELVEMSDPSLQLYTRPIYKSKSDELGLIKLNDFRFNVGVIIKSSRGDYLSLPTSIGRFVSSVTTARNDGEESETINPALVPCTDLFDYVNEDISFGPQDYIDNGLCVDPEAGLVQGSSIYDITAKLLLVFEQCVGPDCMSKVQFNEWVRENVPEFSLIYSYNFVDMSLVESPLRSTVSQRLVGLLEENIEVSSIALLSLHEITLSDELFNPLPTDGEETLYMNIESINLTNTKKPLS